MEKPKIKVLEIDLGIDTASEIKRSAQDVSKEVKDRITQIVEEKKTKEANTPKNKEKAQMESFIQKLFTGEEFDGKQIIEMYGTPISLSPLVLKIRHYISKNKPGFELSKVGKKYKVVQIAQGPTHEELCNKIVGPTDLLGLGEGGEHIPGPYDPIDPENEDPI